VTIKLRNTVLLLLAGVSIFCHAAPQPTAVDLTGRWLHEDVSADGNRVQIVLVLKQDHESLSGRVIFSWGEIRIREGKVSGYSFWFSAMTPADSQHPATYVGKLNGKVLEVHSHWPGNNNTDYTATRAADTVGEPPARIPPPELRELPYNGLAATPPMGWNSWNHFQEKIDDKAVREIADTIVASGMRDAGYVYVNIDDTWEGERDAQGVIHSNRKFPDMRALADYVHSKGLKLGIYSSPGPKTCGGYEGSYGHEEQDAKTYAEWGIDYLKYDWCSAGRIYGNQDLRAVYQKMGEALEKSGRPIVYSLCEYGMGDVWKWGPAVAANLWRTTGDITDHWSALSYTGFAQSRLAPYAAPGHWNDPDMLEIGNGGMSNIEYRTHMTLWAMLAAPLLAGNDPRSMTPEIRDILTNREVIAIDQDRLGSQGKQALQEGTSEVWIRTLEDKSMAIALFNRGDSPRHVSFTWSQLGVKAPSYLRDLWAHTDHPVNADGFDAEIPGHGSVMLRAQW
jgi:alpha-galactosidase